MSLIQSIDHINVQVPSEKEADAKRLYGEVLGMKPIVNPDNPDARGAHYHICDGSPLQLHLGICNEKDAAQNLGLRRHVAFYVFDVAATLKAVEEAGFNIEDAEAVRSEARNSSLKYFFIRDPGDNRIEIMEIGK